MYNPEDRKGVDHARAGYWSILALGFLVSALELPGKSPAMTLSFDDSKNRGKNP
jgi:hypothetical protein